LGGLTDADIDTVWGCAGWGCEGAGTQLKPPVFALEQNSPNPFKPVTNIFFSIPEKTEVELYVCDVSGRVVKRLVDGVPMEPGRYEATWDGRNDAGRTVSSGVYFCKLLAADKVAQTKMVILK
jgi:flagellar hook assembly protein FlgD